MRLRGGAGTSLVSPSTCAHGFPFSSNQPPQHDKVTGFCCRRQFLCRVLNKQPFTHYPDLARMLAEVENIYQQVQELYCCSQCSGATEGGGVGGSMALRDDVIFIDALRGINREVTRQAAGEDAVEEGLCCKRPTGEEVMEEKEIEEKGGGGGEMEGGRC